MPETKFTDKISTAFFTLVGHIQDFNASVRCFVDKFISPKLKRKIVKCVDKLLDCIIYFGIGVLVLYLPFSLFLTQYGMEIMLLTGLLCVLAPIVGTGMYLTHKYDKKRAKEAAKWLLKEKSSKS